MKLIKIILSLLLLFLSTISFADPNTKNNVKAVCEVSHNISYSEQIDLNKELTDLKNENIDLKNNIKLTDEKVNQSILGKSNFITFISWTSGIVMSFVGLLFGLFSFLMFRDNKKNIEKTEKVLKDAEDLKSEFEKWFKLKQDEFKSVIRSDYRKALIILENSSKLEELKNILTNKKLEPKKIYPLVSSLAANPTIEYKPYFSKVIELNISDEISEIAKKGIDKIETLV